MRIVSLLAMLLSSASITAALGQADPGPRGGSAAAGQSLPNIDQTFFNTTRDKFSEVEGVADGMEPRFNLDQCSGWHIFPAVGGSSTAVNSQIAVATFRGAKNTIPPFISRTSPIREARFIKQPNGQPDGGVHDLFVISGRDDAPECNITQPNFAAQIAQHNIIFRIPTPLFGLGPVEGTPDSNLREMALAQQKVPGVKGHFNTNGNDGTITRFGWKAQNKSLLLFSGEAYNVEMGITNEIFTNEREETSQCQFNNLPENFGKQNTDQVSPIDAVGDIINFAAFARSLAPPEPAPATISTITGKKIFSSIGCDSCHLPTQITGRLAVNGMSNVVYHPYSDFAVHKMGERLADHITQGNAAGDEFRTAPLWGLGQRLFFLHDGRTNNLLHAIEAHASKDSEANGVIAGFNRLPANLKQHLLDFLRSL